MNKFMCNNKTFETVITNTKTTHGADLLPAVKHANGNKRLLESCFDFALQYSAPLTHL